MHIHDDGSFTAAYTFEDGHGNTLVWFDTPTAESPDQGYYIIPFIDGLGCSGSHSLHSTKYTLLPAGPIKPDALKVIRKNIDSYTVKNKLRITFTGCCSCPTCRVMMN